MAHLDHKDKAPKQISCAVMTVSDTRNTETDASGALIKKLLKENGHKVTQYAIVKDHPVSIKETIIKILKDPETEGVIITGGTGISKKDSTFEVVQEILEKELDGFGELFRFLSFQSIGSPAMLSRATAGVFQGKLIFSLPGSENAVQLAMARLVLPELPHMVYLIR
ncbi:MAG TPA: MogA/MoaB family molybdenum cofactor biosynthesis protein [Nitrospiria bacterium]|jgi:molybdenum cofactor biosynthesis protein B